MDFHDKFPKKYKIIQKSQKKINSKRNRFFNIYFTIFFKFYFGKYEYEIRIQESLLPNRIGLNPESVRNITNI